MERGDGCGTLWFRDGRVFVNSYTAGEEVVGKGVLWETDGTARRVRNGKPVEEISLEKSTDYKPSCASQKSDGLQARVPALPAIRRSPAATRSATSSISSEQARR